MLTLNQVLDFRRDYNCPLFVDAVSNGGPATGYNVEITADGRTRGCHVSTGTAEDAVLQALSPFWNMPIRKEEFRFTTHDFANPATWDGRTNGDPAQTWAVANGGVAFEDLQYDDVTYRWVDVNGAEVCHLEAVEGGIGSTWKDPLGNVVVSYNAVTKHWERADTSANVTSSRWSVIPYDNTKMSLILANSLFHSLAVMAAGKSLRYQIYQYLTAAELAVVGFAGAPAGVYKAKEFAYATPALLKLSADHWSTGTDSMVSATYDYRTTTIPYIDARLQMRMEIILDDHLPIVPNAGEQALAVFIGNKIASF